LTGTEINGSADLDVVLSAAMGGLVDHNLIAHTVTYSERWHLLLGFHPEVRPSETPDLWLDLCHPDDRAAVEEEWKSHVTEAWPLQMTWRMRHADGAYRWMQCRSAASIDESGSPVRALALFTDVTEQVEASQRHLSLVEAIPDTLLRVDRSGAVLDLRTGKSRAAQSLFVVARPMAPLAEACLDEKLVTAINDAVQLALQRGETQMITWSGERADAFFEIRVVPGANEAVCLIRDATDRKHLEVQLVQAQKLEAIGQLAAGVAHEINTPLQFIGDNVRFVQTASERLMGLVEQFQAVIEACASDDEKKRVKKIEKRSKLEFLKKNFPGALESCIEGVNRVHEIVGAMKEFSHQGSEEAETLDVNHCLSTTLKVSRNEWKNIAEIKEHFDAELPCIKGHRGELNQCFLNIIVNAAHALCDRYGETLAGCITITTQPWQQDGVEVRIADNGTGIPDAVKQRIFEPFFTTKEVGKGTGQGLSIAYKTIVDRHGGQLSCETVDGQGTEFVIRLWPEPPARQSGEADSGAKSEPRPRVASTPAAGRGLRVLIAEDNAVACAVLTRILERLGAQVVAVEDGDDAVAAHQGEPFDAVFLDLNMPRLDGFEALEQIRGLPESGASSEGARPRREVPVVLVSAGFSQPQKDRASSLGVVGYLNKPCQLDHVRDVLSRIESPRLPDAAVA
jgi:signal transduction histidine kinase/CheY-like chemotaxis protein